MKRFLRSAVLLLALSLLLCACAGKSAAPTPSPAPTAAPSPSPTAAATEPPSPLTKFAGTYEGYSVFIQNQYIRWEPIAGHSVRLDSDGKGYLDWGEGNRGPIHEWTTNGDGLILKAGVSVMDARCDGQVLYIDLDDGMELCFIKAGTDTSAMPIVDKEALAAPAEKPIAGVYYPYAMESDGVCVRSPAFGTDEDGMITIRDDGTFLIMTGEIENAATWTAEGDVLTLVDEAGNRLSDLMTVTVPKDGIFTFEYLGQNQKIYYATLEADTSSIESISVEEYKAGQN